ncbi:hypothetical protein FSC37_16675 [Piscinibacter aquaticus]|uniref:PNPLA domain-containing protein n=1 Tax=Piscinibacter aquaticus TaxID=392597 RepID=A0A5C6U435_9BURK|nr:hypothetical protein FSC37_16675 [Piscinibacter aquaticus]
MAGHDPSARRGLALAASALLSVHAQTAAPSRTGLIEPPARPRIGLVLSGGGARGLAHVGVLKVLERERVPIDVITGTSMGAIIGGLYASGMSAGQLEAELLKVDWNAVFASRVDRQLLSQRRKEEDFEISPVIEIGMRDGELRAPLGALSGARPGDAAAPLHAARARGARLRCTADAVPRGGHRHGERPPGGVLARRSRAGAALEHERAGRVRAHGGGRPHPRRWRPRQQRAGRRGTGDGRAGAERREHRHAAGRARDARLGRRPDGADDQHPDRAERAAQPGVAGGTRRADRARARHADLVGLRAHARADRPGQARRRATGRAAGGAGPGRSRLCAMAQHARTACQARSDDFVRPLRGHGADQPPTLRSAARITARTALRSGQGGARCTASGGQRRLHARRLPARLDDRRRRAGLRSGGQALGAALLPHRAGSRDRLPRRQRLQRQDQPQPPLARCEWQRVAQPVQIGRCRAGTPRSITR